MALNYQNNVFKDLIESYPTWDDMRKYLESEEGGLFRIADKNDESGLCIIRYEKGTSKMELPHSKWFRSVVWNTKTNRPVCVAPPKASSQEFPFKTLAEASDAGIVCQELLDGFMINCFKMAGDETLHITSRSKLNAAGKFYSEKSFRDLFMEAYTENGSINICSPDSSTNEVAVFYSFLVQHKEHRIVKPIDSTKIYTIHKGIVYSDGIVSFMDSPNMNDGAEVTNIPMEQKAPKGSYAQIAARVADNDSEQSEVQKWIKNILQEKDWQFQGLVFKDATGNRWRFRSEKYAAVKALRGNSPTVRERFAQLYSQNLLHKYIEYYQDESVHMTVHLMFMSGIIKMLYDMYVDLHITKTKKAYEIDKMYLPHLYNIHGLYLSQLRPAGKKVNIAEITLYLHKQPWQRVSFLIKKIVDAINTESSASV
jgi:hypothetical protein